MNKKREKFVKLTNNRVNKAIKQISLIGNLSNRNNYDYSEEEAKQIFKALEDEIRECKSRFEGQSKTDKKFSI